MSKSVTGAELVALLSDPQSVAIVGASADPNAYGGRPVTYLRDYGYAGRITLVNPNRDEVHGMPCLKSASEIEHGSVDVAMVAIPAGPTPDAVKELAAAGVKVTIAIAGNMTAEQKADIRATAEATGMRIIGPNCIGVVANRSSTYLSFSTQIREQQPPQGSVALITQSGAMGNAALASIRRRGAGISHWVTTGDEVNVGALELITGLLYDEDVQAVGAFFEGMGDVEWLPEIERAIHATGKRVFVVKGAKTSAGQSAAAGHTGRVVGSAEASLEVMSAAGIVEIPDMASLSDVLVTLDLAGAPKGRRVGIVTISGGAGVLAADRVVESDNLVLSELSEADEELSSRLGGRVHEIANPLDVAGSPTDVFADWVNTVARLPSSNAVIAIQAPMIHDTDVLVRELTAYQDRTVPLVIGMFSEGDPLPTEAILALAGAGIPVVPSAERAVFALDALAANLDQGPALTDEAHDDHGDDATVVGYEASIDVLGSDLPWARFAVPETVEEARAQAAELGFPLVVKVAGRKLQHRTESGGVQVGVTDSALDSSFRAVDAIAREAGDAVLLQQMAAKGVEVMVSCVADRELGAVAYVRPGGILTELVRGGTAIIWHGWPEERRREKLRASIVGQLLDGYRGGAVYDMEELAHVVDRVLDAVQSGRANFVELNPVIVSENGATLVDALVRPFADQ